MGTITSGTWHGTAIQDAYIASSANWNTAYSERNQWDGGATGLNALTGRTSLGLGSLATASTINNGDWSGTQLAVANGGTGATDTSGARTNLGLGNVENTALSTWAGTSNITTLGTITTGTWNAGAVTSSGAIQGTSLNVGAGAISGGTVNGATISGGALSGGTLSGGNVSGGTLTALAVNGVTTANILLSTGSYSDPTWITSLAKSKVGLGNVENTALSTWAGSANITTLGTVAQGTWNGTAIQDAYIASSANWNTAYSERNQWDGGATGLVAATGRTSLGLGSLATASTINNGNWSGTDLAVANGGTGASDAGTARTNLGLAIGSDIQGYNSGLSDIAGIAKTDGNFIVGNGTNWVAESGATVRTSLGLGSIATQASDNVAITGGSITGTTTWNAGAITSSGAIQGTSLNVGAGAISGGTVNGATISGGTLSGGNVQGGTLTATAVNGVTTANILLSTGSYSDPTWITSLAKSKVGLGNVENTALSTWAGSANMTTLGTIAQGTWNGSAIQNSYIASATNWNTAYSERNQWNGGATGLVAATGRTSLGLGSLATASTINNGNWSGTQLSVANGGTGAIDASGARTNLGLGSVENTALSTWGGTSNISTVGTITSGTWNAGAVTSSGAIQGTSVTATGLTLGSVLFAGTGGALSQDNSNLFWDNTNKRLGIGTASPGNYKLNVNGVISGVSYFTSYTTDGLFGAGALPSIITTPGGSDRGVLFGYIDSGGGQYSPRIGFLQPTGTGLTAAKASIGLEIDGKLSIGAGASNATAVTIDQSGNVGIGTTTPTEKLEVAGRIMSTGSSYTVNPQGPIFGQYNSTIGYVQAPSGGQLDIWNGATEAITTFHNNGNVTIPGNVGIGTTSPWDKLVVNRGVVNDSSGGITINNDATNGYGGALSITGNVSGTNYVLGRMSAENISTGGYLAFSTAAVGYGLNERVRIDNNGNVGIGTTVPLAKLQVSGLNNTSILLQSAVADATESTATLFFRTLNGATDEFKKNAIIAHRSSSSPWGNSDLIFAVRTTGDSANADISDAKLFISGSSGNVGIGTTTPGALLEVGTNVAITSPRVKIIGYSDTVPLQEWGDGGSVYTRLGRSVANAMFMSQANYGGADFEFRGNYNFINQVKFPGSGIWNSSGNVGIGTASPANKLTINAPVTADTLATTIITPTVATNKGLVVQGYTSQTADLIQGQSSAGAVLFKVDSSGNLTAKSATFTGTLTMNGHIITGNSSGSTTIEVGNSLDVCSGSGMVSITGNDTSGTITVTAGDCPEPGPLAIVTFARAYGSAPNVIIAPKTNGNGATLQYYTNPGLYNFTLNSNNSPSAYSAYTYSYMVMQ